MENTSGITNHTENSLQIINNQMINPVVKYNNQYPETITRNLLLEVLKSEYRENFAYYLDRIGLAKDQNPIVLSSKHYYYYDAEELRNVNTIINLKELNRVKEIRSFLHSIFKSLGPKSNFVGCFIDNSKVNAFALGTNLSPYHTIKNSAAIENGIISQNPFMNKLYSFMDSRTYNTMSEISASLLLENYGLKVLDMTEINGITYFHTQKFRSAEN